ncbi:ABC transporter substrate-binding protein, partial [Agrococcus baldri]|uniref:ABC transporter substrate-binding protein n=1 Tax=Agrococcus baldri TaxID=153730 RepID=UPI0011BDB094
MNRITPRRRTARPHTIGAMLILGGLVLSGCAASGEEPAPSGSDAPVDDTALPTGTEPQPLAERTTITINTAARIESFSALFLAEEMGEFDRENIDVEFTQIASSDALAGLGQDQIQMMGAAPNGSLFNAIHEGVAVNVTIPCYINSVDRWWVRTEILEQGPEALAGSTVASAVGPGGSSILGLDTYLQEGGLSISDVTVQAFPAADVPQALIQGAVDAAYVPEPGARAVAASGLAEPVESMPVDGGSAQCVYVFGPDLAT